MGIRIHRYLGFGVDDVQVTKPRNYGCPNIKDPRFARKQWSALSEKAYEMSPEDCIKWLKENEQGLMDFYQQVTGDGVEFGVEFKLKLMISCTRDQPGLTFKHLVHDREFGDPNVLMFIPFTCENWQRYDDDLDYYFETVLHKQRAHHHFIEGTVYPWHSWVVDGEVPQEVKDILLRLNPKTEIWSEITDRELHSLEIYLDKDILSELKTRLRPFLPLEACATVWFWRSLFRDPVEFAKQLRPMIYTYWS